MRLANNPQNITFDISLGSARRDENGTYYNALGLESTEEHKHVSVIWQNKCIPLYDFAGDIKKQQEHKFDRILNVDELKLTDKLTLKDGTGFTMNGLLTFPRNSMRQGMVEYLTSDSPLDKPRALADLAYYLNTELDKVAGNRDTVLENRLERKKSALADTSLVPSAVKKLQQEIEQVENRLNDSKKFIVRFRNDDDDNSVARFVGSDRYGVINNEDVIQAVVDALPGGGSDALVSHAWTDGDNMIGNILLPDYIKTRPDSEYGVGISFKNSEIGRFRFKIQAFLFRAICLNGCIWGRSNVDNTIEINIDKKHLGQIDMAAIYAQVYNTVRVALNEGEQVLELFDITKEVTVQNQDRLIASLTKELKLTIPQGRAWIEAVKAEPGETVFHTIQGLTRAAQEYNGDTRQAMEESAGMILAPSLESDIDSIAKMWKKFEVRAESLSEKELKSYMLV
jgi:hypothetical protein